jgi:hypothetical protein
LSQDQDGTSIFSSPVSIDSIVGNGLATANFNVIAQATVSKRDTFTVSLLAGTGGNTKAPVRIEAAVDSSAAVYIESSTLYSFTSISSSQAADSVVSTGQIFTLSSSVHAAPDQYREVRAILTVPDGFGVTGSKVIGIAAEDTVISWSITAPQTASAGPSQVTIHVEAKNSGEEQVTTPTEIISIRTITRPQLRVVSHVAQPPGARSILAGRQFVVQAEMENDGEAAVAGSIPVRLSFQSNAYTTTDNLVQTFTVGAPASWTIQAPSQAVLASKIYCTIDRNDPPDDENGVESNIIDDSSAVVISTISDTSVTFSNFPNPFGGPDPKDKTTLYYYLRNDTDVNIRIYSLLGELVWQRAFKATDGQGRAGAHSEVTWDAKNGDGQFVLNGVYIAYLATGDGQRATRKIAVMK